MNHELIIGYGGLAGVLIAAITVIVTLRGIRDQLWLSTFAEYTSRYSQIMGRVPFAVRDPNGGVTLDDLSDHERECVLGAVRMYANLCSEELYLHDRKLIDKETWEIWQTGIRDTLRAPCFRAGWQKIRGDYKYYSDFQDRMDGFIKDGDGLQAIASTAEDRAE